MILSVFFVWMHCFLTGHSLQHSTFVDGYLLDITCFGFPRLYRRCPQLPTLRAGIFVFFRIVIHIFSAANIRLVFALLFLLVI